MRQFSAIPLTLVLVLMAYPWLSAQQPAQQAALRLNDREYFEMPGVSVMAFQNIYPEGHQGGVSIIQNGVRVASNGDLRLDATPGQWQPVPKQDKRVVSGTALIRPDFPELKDFPYLWQQMEYVMGGGSSNFMFLVLAADQLPAGDSPLPAGR